MTLAADSSETLCEIKRNFIASAVTFCCQGWHVALSSSVGLAVASSDGEDTAARQQHDDVACS